MPNTEDIKKQNDSVFIPDGFYDKKVSQKTIESAYAPGIESVNPEYGKSQYDIGLRAQETYDQKLINENRAIQQSNADKVANALINTTGIAATTFAQTFTSLPYGVVSAVTSGKASDIYNNPISLSYQKGLDYLKEKYPTYYTEQEQKAEWYSPDNWWKTNFLMDKVVTNLGFTVGAIASGYVAGGAISAIGKIMMGGSYASELAAIESMTAKLIGEGVEQSVAFTKAMNTVGKGIKLTNSIAKMGAITASAGTEASIEALQTKQGIKQRLIDEVKQKYNREPTEQELQRFDELSSAGGNVAMATNMAILAGSDLIQFGRFLTPYKAERKAILNGISRKTEGDLIGEYAKDVIEDAPTRMSRIYNTAKKIAPAFKGILTESAEEGSQFVTQQGATEYYSKKYWQPSADSLQDKLNAVGYGLEQTFGTKAGIESIFIGGLTGGFTSIVTGEVSRSLRESGLREEEQNALLENINTNKLNNIFGNAIRDEFYQKQMNNASEKNDKHQFENIKFDDFKSFVDSRVVAGRFDLVENELKEMGQLPKEEFEKLSGPITKTPMEITDNLIKEAKKIRDTRENVEQRFYYAPKEVRESFVDYLTNIENSDNRARLIRQSLSKTPELLSAVDSFILDTTPESLDNVVKIAAKANAKLIDEVVAPIQMVDDLIELIKRKEEFTYYFNKYSSEDGMKQLAKEQRARIIRDKQEQKDKEKQQPLETDTEVETESGKINIPEGYKIYEEGDSNEGIQKNYQNAGIDIVPINQEKTSALERESNIPTPEDLQFRVDDEESIKEESFSLDDKLKELGYTDGEISNISTDEQKKSAILKATNDSKEISDKIKNAYPLSPKETAIYGKRKKYIDSLLSNKQPSETKKEQEDAVVEFPTESDINKSIDLDRKAEYENTIAGNIMRGILNTSGEYTTMTVAYHTQQSEILVGGEHRTLIDEYGKIIPKEDFDKSVLFKDSWTAGDSIELSIDETHESYNEHKDNKDTVPIIIKLKGKKNSGRMFLPIISSNNKTKYDSDTILQISKIRGSIALGEVLEGNVLSKSGGPLNTIYDNGLNYTDVNETFGNDNNIIFGVQTSKGLKLSDESKRGLVGNDLKNGTVVAFVESSNGTLKPIQFIPTLFSDSLGLDQIVNNISGIINSHLAGNQQLKDVGINSTQKVIDEVNKYLYNYENLKGKNINVDEGFSIGVNPKTSKINISTRVKDKATGFNLFSIEKDNVQRYNLENDVYEDYGSLEDLLKNELSNKHLNITKNILDNNNFDYVEFKDGQFNKVNSTYLEFLSKHDIARTYVENIKVNGKSTFTTQPVVEIGNIRKQNKYSSRKKINYNLESTNLETIFPSINIGGVTVERKINKFRATETTIINNKTKEGILQIISEDKGSVIYAPIIGYNFMESVSKYSGRNINEQTDIIFNNIPLNEILNQYNNQLKLEGKSKILESVNKSIENKKSVFDFHGTLVDENSTIRPYPLNALGTDVVEKINNNTIDLKDFYIVSSGMDVKTEMLKSLGLNNQSQEWIDEHVLTGEDGVNYDNKNDYISEISGNKVFVDNTQDVVDEITDTKTDTVLYEDKQVQEIHSLDELGDAIDDTEVLSFTEADRSLELIEKLNEVTEEQVEDRKKKCSPKKIKK